MNEQLAKASKPITYYYILPDGEKTLPISGSAPFIRDMREMLDLMTHSPTALKILDHNANLPKPLVIEEWENPLDSGRNENGRVQIANGKLKDGSIVDKYSWLTLVPHEFRHSYNIRSKSTILQSVAYAIANEPDAQAMGCLIALELSDYLKKNEATIHNASVIRERLDSITLHRTFRQFYNEAQGTEKEKKATAIIRFSQHWTSRVWDNEYYHKRTIAENAYRIGIERDISPNGGWDRLNEETFPPVEAELFQKEAGIIRKEWPTFCKRLMDGTYNTDVIPYGQDVKPADLIQMISPKLAAHLREVGIIPQNRTQPTPIQSTGNHM